MDTMSFVIRARLKVAEALARPFRYFGAEWERMAARERRLIAALSIAVVVVGSALGVFLVYTSISDLEEGNADIREALKAIAKHRDEYLDAKARAQAQETRLGTEPPQLVADIEAAAREETVAISESNERPPIAVAKRWTQHDVDLKVLTQFLKRVETGTRPIFFTRVNIKRRFSDNDKLDAELTATASERIKEGAVTGKKKPDDKDKAASKLEGNADKAAKADKGSP